MSPVELGLSAWIAFNTALGVDLQKSLLPPALDNQIASVEQVIGYALPQDLSKLYLLANGQLDPFNAPFSGRFAPMFGRYRFLTLAQALDAYQRLQTQYDADQQWIAKSSAVVWDVREGDSVDSAGWNPNWFVFASDQTNYYSVDMSPPPGGQPGQVVLHGVDQWELRVIAASVSELLLQGAARLDPREPYRFEQSEPMATLLKDSDSSPADDPGELFWSYLQFSMDWRDKPSVPQSEDPQNSVTYADWDSARELRVDDFLRWLEDATGFNAAQFSAGQNDTGQNDTDEAGNPWGDEEMSTLREWVYINFSLGPSALFAEPAPGSIIPSYAHHDYLTWLEQNMMLPTDYIDDTLPVTRSQALSLVHQYQLEAGGWSQREYAKAQAILDKYSD